MIVEKRGDIFDVEVDALVNPVNCVGVMGKGLALEFKKRFPGNYQSYKAACSSGYLKPGDMHIAITDCPYPKYIINFPTKDDWRNPSKLEYIQTGLTSLIDCIGRLDIRSISLPALGCGNGNLSWDSVRPLLYNAFSQLSNVNVYIYTPL